MQVYSQTSMHVINLIIFLDNSFMHCSHACSVSKITDSTRTIVAIHNLLLQFIHKTSSLPYLRTHLALVLPSIDGIGARGLVLGWQRRTGGGGGWGRHLGGGVDGLGDYKHAPRPRPRPGNGWRRRGAAGGTGSCPRASVHLLTVVTVVHAP